MWGSTELYTHWKAVTSMLAFVLKVSFGRRKIYFRNYLETLFSGHLCQMPPVFGLLNIKKSDVLKQRGKVEHLKRH